jgi:hypothetical protein
MWVLMPKKRLELLITRSSIKCINRLCYLGLLYMFDTLIGLIFYTMVKYISISTLVQGSDYPYSNPLGEPTMRVKLVNMICPIVSQL